VGEGEKLAGAEGESVARGEALKEAVVLCEGVAAALPLPRLDCEGVG